MKIVKRILKWLFRIVGILLTLIIVALGLAIGRLYISPMEIKEFLPTLESYILPPESGLKLDAESVTLKAAFTPKGLVHIDIKNMTILKGKVPALKLPDVEMSYNFKNLTTLNYMPNDLSIRQAQLYLIIAPDGQVYLSGSIPQKEAEENSAIPLAGDKPTSIDKLFNHLLSLGDISLEKSSVRIEDQQKNQETALNDLELNFIRASRHKRNLKLSGNLSLENQITHLSLQAQLDRKERLVSFEVEADPLNLMLLGQNVPVLKEAELTIRGKVNGLFDFEENCQHILACFKEGSFQIKTLKPGKLNLPDPLTNVYLVESATVNGAIGADLEQIKIAKSTLQLTNGPTADLQVDVTGLGSVLMGNPLENLKIVLKASLSSLPIEQVPDVWPVATGPDAHAWVKENLTKGKVEKADFTLYFTGGDLTDLYGELPVSGIQVRYLDEMTPVQNFAGVVKLYPERVFITGNKGTVRGLSLTDAVIDLTELKNEISNAKIILDIQGPVQDAISLISEKPLEFAQMFELKPEQTGGKGTIHVDLGFPLADDLTTDQVKALVRADITDGIFPTVINGYQLKKGELNLQVSNKQLDLSGKGMIAGIPLDLSWTEFFTAKKPTDISSKYQLNLVATDAELDPLFPAFKDYINGSVSMQATLQSTLENALSGQVEVDLKNAEINLYQLTLQKSKGIKTNLTATVTNQGKKTTLDYQVHGSVDEKELNPISIRGNAVLDKDRYQVRLDEVIAPKTDFKATLDLKPDKEISLKLNGQSWNAAGIYQIPKEEKKEDEEKKDEEVKPADPFAIPDNIDFDISIKRLILKEDKPVTNVMAVGKKVNNRWQNLSVNAVAGTPFNISYLPKKEILMADTTDLGGLLEHLGVTEKVAKGSFVLNAHQKSEGGFNGTIEVKDLSLKEPGFLVQAFTILGILDAIRGEDLFFEKGIVPFKVAPDSVLKIAIEEGYLAGNSLGITFDGEIVHNIANLSGSVIPAYMINSLPGKIPLIGGLFKDGKGGGLMGAKYDLKGPISDPEVEFKALSSMAPGILGKLFD